LLEYKELDDLVRRYRDGDNDAANEIVRHFEGFIMKFINLIKYGRLDISDTSLRSYVGLYIKKPYVLKRLHGYYKYKDVVEEILKRASWIQNIFKNNEKEEVYNELVCILLEMANRYKLRDDGVYCFHTYVQKSFHYYVHRHLQKLITDPSAFANELTNFNYTDEELDNQDFIDNLIYKQGRCKQTELTSEIDENWICGFTCEEAYLKFNPLDRRILQLYYIYEMSDQKIANTLGLCRATINRKRLAAKTYIKGHSDHE